MSYSASWTPGSTPRTSKTDSSDSHETAQPVSLSGQRAPMHVTIADWTVVIISIAVSFLPALFFFRRASKSTTEFFASGRAAPWWLVGVSMVATTFSTDTPNLVTNMVRESGVAENWLWWSFLLTGMLTVFFYARLWRRSNVLTDLEFYELRYSGKAASFVRGFRAVYLGLFFNCVIMAAVNLAAAKIANIVLGWPLEKTLLLMGVVTVFFASVSGLWGVLVTDSIQFGITMTATFALAYFALSQPQVGGLSGLIAQIDPKRLRLIPDFGDWGLTLSVLIIPLTIQWWSVWYPGAEPGGGSYIAQRMLASRTEKDAVVGTLLFNAMHYALRPWPWILVALASTVIYPQLSDIARAYPYIDPSLIGNDMAYPAMYRSFLVALGFAIAARAGHAVPGHISLILTVASTTVVWVAVAYLTPPTDRTTLLSFYKLVRPAGPGWESIRQEAGLASSPDSLPNSLLGWVFGCAFIYAALFGTGSALYGRMPQAILWAAVFLVSGFGLLRLVPRMWGKQEAGGG